MHVAVDCEGPLSKEPTQCERENLSLRLVLGFRQIFRNISVVFSGFSYRLNVYEAVLRLFELFIFGNPVLFSNLSNLELIVMKNHQYVTVRITFFDASKERK